MTHMLRTRHAYTSPTGKGSGGTGEDFKFYRQISASWSKLYATSLPTWTSTFVTTSVSPRANTTPGPHYQFVLTYGLFRTKFVPVMFPQLFSTWPERYSPPSFFLTVVPGPALPQTRFMSIPTSSTWSRARSLLSYYRFSPFISLSRHPSSCSLEQVARLLPSSLPLLAILLSSDSPLGLPEDGLPQYIPS